MRTWRALSSPALSTERVAQPGVEAFMPRASLPSTAKLHSGALASYGEVPVHSAVSVKGCPRTDESFYFPGRGSIPLAWQKRARILQVPGIQMKSSQILDGVVLYNTLKRDKEPFVAKQNGKVRAFKRCTVHMLFQSLSMSISGLNVHLWTNRIRFRTHWQLPCVPDLRSSETLAQLCRIRRGSRL